MTRSFVAVACCASLLLSAAQAGEEPGQWYVTPMLSAFYADSSRNADDDFGFAVAFGRAYDAFNVEAHANYYDLGGYNGTEIWSVGVDFVKVLYRPERISAFMLAGTGYTDSSQDRNEDSSNMYGNMGFGLLTDFSADGKGMALRTEVRYRLDFADPTENDWVGNIGVQIPFGGN